MKVYIQTDSRGVAYNVNAFNAIKGFEQMVKDYKDAPAG